MDSQPYYLPPTLAKNHSILTEEKLTGQSADNTFSHKSPYGLSPTDKKGKFLFDDMLQKQNDPIKLFATLQSSGKKVVDDIEEISKQIYKAKLPFLSYYHPETETLKSRKEIIAEMQHQFDFFQAAPNRGRSRPQTRSIQNEEKPLSAPHKDFRITKSKASIHRSKYGFKIFEDKPGFIIDRGDLKEDVAEDVNRVSASNTHQIYQETAASSESPYSPDIVSAKTEKERVPVDLNQAALKRKKLIQDLKKGKDIKAITIQTDLGADGQLGNTNNEKSDNTRSGLYTVQRSRLLKKIDFTTKSPYSNAYYHILAMPSPQRKNVMSKLNISPVANINSEKIIREGKRKAI